MREPHYACKWEGETVAAAHNFSVEHLKVTAWYADRVLARHGYSAQQYDGPEDSNRSVATELR